MTRYALLTFLLLLTGGCRVHDFCDLCKPTVCIPEEYSFEKQGVAYGDWWKEFGISELDDVVTLVLDNNLNLKQSFWQVVEACYQAKVVAGFQWPTIDNTFTNLRQKPSPETNLPPIVAQNGHLLSTTLSYEVDLWKKLDSRTQAAKLEWCATQEDFEAAALALTGVTVDLWFTIQEQKTLLDVVRQQVESSRTQLELIELRFSVGESTALEVYQQRLQLAQTESQIPPIQSELQRSINQMHVLMGSPPGWDCFSTEGKLVDLPPFPEVKTPEVLLCSRPDLRAQQRRLQAADYEVAAAIADRFPRLDLALTYDLESNSLKRLLCGEAWQLLSSVFTPVFDASRRKNEAERRKAIVCDYLAGYGDAFLNALLEVEDSVVQEKYQLELIADLERQIDIAEKNMEQAQFQYLYGLTDYLTVIAAIQNLQATQRLIVTEKKRLLVFRSRLYRALGGSPIYG